MLTSTRKTALRAFAALLLLCFAACSKSAAPGPDPQKLAALKEALKNGVLTQPEYDAKVAQLTAGAAAAAPSGTGGSSSPSSASSSSEMTTIPVVDPVFNMPAFTVTLPKNWTFEGAVLRGACGGTPMYVFRASSPDGLTGIQDMPRVDWFYAEDPRAIKMNGWSTCNLHKPVPASEQINEIAAKARPDPQIGPVEKPPTPVLDQAMAKNNEAFDQQARANGQPQNGSHISADTARVRLHYNFQGHAEEEWLTVTAQVWDMGVSVIGSGRNGIIQPQWVRAQHTQTFVTSLRAPEGKLDSSKALLNQINASFMLVPQYEQAFLAMQQRNFAAAQAASNAAFQALHQQGEANMQAMQQRHNEYMQWQNQRSQAQSQQFQADMARKDSQHQNFMDYIQDQQYYQNPETGSTVTVRNVPGATGVVAPSTVNGNWVQLVPISH